MFVMSFSNWHINILNAKNIQFIILTINQKKIIIEKYDWYYSFIVKNYIKLEFKNLYLFFLDSIRRKCCNTLKKNLKKIVLENIVSVVYKYKILFISLYY